MAAGLTIPRIRELAGKDYPVIRIMPNTPSGIGEGMVFYDCSNGVTKTEEKVFLESLAGAGQRLQKNLFFRFGDAVAAVIEYHALPNTGGSIGHNADDRIVFARQLPDAGNGQPRRHGNQDEPALPLLQNRRDVCLLYTSDAADDTP